MNLDDYSYKLDDKLIAKYPPKTRGTTRLLVLDRKTGDIVDSEYSKLDEYLRANDLLVINNTRVIKARLQAVTETGKPRELLILERHQQAIDKRAFKVMYRGKLEPSQILMVGDQKIKVLKLNDDGTAIVSSDMDVYKLSDEYGSVPLPPYLKRDAQQQDTIRYQTVIAKEPGSVAAPTASLNITNNLLNKLDSKGVKTTELTLHVGLGTFMPIRVDNLSDHKMHQEYFEIPGDSASSIIEAKKSGNRVIAVGTTVTRALEYSAPSIIGSSAKLPISGEADIFIYPGYNFKIVDAMVTNFHAPKSTVLMMAAAFAGWDNLKRAYDHASKHKYSFLSYGDSMLII
ncbi:MAG TPA: tRNA preQ1(34) S-adenosylmethionine ribosyltransferase-isomerase QueA [Candidatus Saccharimonadales bacterium]